MPQWQRKVLQASLKALQRSANTSVRKAIGRKVKEGRGYLTHGDREMGKGEVRKYILYCVAG